GAQRDAVPASTRNVRHVCKVGDLRGKCTTDRVSAAKLAEGVVTPTPNGSIGPHGQTERLPRGDPHYVADSLDPHGRRSCDGGRVSQLPAAVLSPGPNRAIAFKCKIMI